MLNRQFECLLALDRGRDLKKAAQACSLEPQALMDVLRLAERDFGRPLVRLTEAFDGFTPMGEVVLACAHRLADASPDPVAIGSPATDEASMALLLGRRSVSPKRLGPPGPTPQQLDLIIQAALRAPDHGGLHPWRVISFKDEARDALADLFEQEKLRRDPLASASDRQLAREHATRAPALLAFVVAPHTRAKVPVREQQLAAGAALGNLLNAAHQLGFGAIMLSGERCYDEQLTGQLGVQAGEFLAGFVSLGRVVQVPPARKPVPSDLVWSTWSAPVQAGASAPRRAEAPSKPPEKA